MNSLSISGQRTSAGETLRNDALHRPGDLAQVKVRGRTRGHLVMRGRPCRHAQVTNQLS